MLIAIPEVIVELEALRYKAMLSADLELLDRVLDDELIYIHSTGLRDSKAAYLALIKSQDLVYEAAHTFDPDSVIVGSDFVLLSGRINLEIKWHGTHKTLDNQYVLVWVKRNNGWKLLSWQSTSA